ncbi:AsmA family protein [Aestuariicella hydrocarbonica]|uniref:AsmA family protein n=1 Tax=Pseudomaricurvus hydrocarbonicus TaxID=1470433 RepID=A0A9E5T4Z4_9GAMM|nr:AsmA family protein [Aestuariicella hydrocarbonica]NHO68419.1 AsmA family protein [Aestuariicella hydrocarbonica]
MQGFLRAVMGVLALVVLLVVGAVLYLTLVLDPNDFRQDIERLAQEQGVPLQINGNLSWQFFPNLGLSVEGVKVMTGPEALLDAQRLAAAVAVAPLLSGQVSIQSVEFSGVQVNVWKDKQGRGNWELLLPPDDTAGTGVAPKASESTAPAATQESSASSEATPISLVIEALRLRDATLTYRDEAEGSSVKLSDLNLSIDGFDLTGKLFDLQQSATLALEGQKPIDIRSQGTLGFNLEQQQLTLDSMALEMSVNKTPLTLNLSGDLALETLAAQLQLQLQPVNLAKWLTQFGIELPEMSAADALSKVSMTAAVSGNDGAWDLNPLVLKLDDTTINGQAGIDKVGAMSLTLKGDRIDVDRYLPVPAEQVEQAQAQQPAAGKPPAGSTSGSTASAGAGDPANPLLMSDEPLDLSALKDLTAAANLTFDQVTAKQLDFTSMVFKLKAKDGLVRLQQVSGALDDGQFNLNGALDARQSRAKVNLKGTLTDLELKPLLAVFAEEERLSGVARGDLALNTQGQSLRQWQQGVVANLNLTANQLTLATLDIERSACELAALVNGQPAPAIDWKGLTELNDVQGALALKGTVLNIDALSAGVENLSVKARGDLNYLSGKFDVPLSIAFTGEADPERDCQVRDRWRNKDLPLRCKGTLDTVSARSCGFDSKRINALLADEAKDEVKDKLQEKLLEKLNKDGDDSTNDAVKGLLEGLFKKK